VQPHLAKEYAGFRAPLASIAKGRAVGGVLQQPADFDGVIRTRADAAVGGPYYRRSTRRWRRGAGDQAADVIASRRRPVRGARCSTTGFRRKLQVPVARAG